MAAEGRGRRQSFATACLVVHWNIFKFLVMVFSIISMIVTFFASFALLVELGEANEDSLLKPYVVFFVVVRIIAGAWFSKLYGFLDDMEWCGDKPGSKPLPPAGKVLRIIFNLIVLLLLSLVAMIWFKIKELMNFNDKGRTEEDHRRESLWWLVCFLTWLSVFPIAVIAFIAAGRGYRGGSEVVSGVFALIDVILSSIYFVLLKILKEGSKAHNAVEHADYAVEVNDAEEGGLQVPGGAKPPTGGNVLENGGAILQDLA